MLSRLPRDAAILDLSQALAALNVFFMRVSPFLFPLISL